MVDLSISQFLKDIIKEPSPLLCVLLQKFCTCKHKLYLWWICIKNFLAWCSIWCIVISYLDFFLLIIWSLLILYDSFCLVPVVITPNLTFIGLYFTKLSSVVKSFDVDLKDQNCLWRAFLQTVYLKPGRRLPSWKKKSQHHHQQNPNWGLPKLWLQLDICDLLTS